MEARSQQDSLADAKDAIAANSWSDQDPSLVQSTLTASGLDDDASDIVTEAILLW